MLPHGKSLFSTLGPKHRAPFRPSYHPTGLSLFSCHTPSQLWHARAGGTAETWPVLGPNFCLGVQYEVALWLRGDLVGVIHCSCDTMGRRLRVREKSRAEFVITFVTRGLPGVSISVNKFQMTSSGPPGYTFVSRFRPTLHAWTALPYPRGF